MLQDTTQAALEEAVTDADVFALVGDYDLFTSDELEAAIAARIAGQSTLVLDFTQCTYIDSSILTVLVRAVRLYGDQLRMIVPRSGNVARILSVTQLDRFFPIVSG